MGVNPGELVVLTPWKYVAGVRVNSDSFIQKLLLDNSASFTSSVMKDFCQKWKVKLIIEVPVTVWWLDLTDPDPHIYDRSTPL